MFFSKKKKNQKIESFNQRIEKLDEARLNDFLCDFSTDRAQNGEFHSDISLKLECENLYIIGLGHFGLALCKRIEEKINSYSFSLEKQPELLSICDNIDNDEGDSIIKKINTHPLLGENRTLYMYRKNFYQNYKNSFIRNEIKNVIQGQFQSLKGSSYIFFVFDIYEIESSLIFDLLSYCRTISENSNLIFTILSGNKDSHTNQLNNNEAFAFLREIERVTFNQPNLIIENQFEYKKFNYALIDYLFVTPEFLNSKIDSLGYRKSREIDSAANFILTLLNKNNHPIFEHLNSELKKNGEIQKKTDRAIINLYKIENISINQDEIEKYFSSLLINDVLLDLFGSKDDSDSDLDNGNKEIYELLNDDIYFRWLFSDIKNKKQIIYDPWNVTNYENHFLNNIQSALDERLNKRKVGFSIIKELVTLKRNFERVQIEITENKEIYNKKIEEADLYFSKIISLIIKNLESIIDQIKVFQRKVNNSSGVVFQFGSTNDENKDWRLILDENRNDFQKFQENEFRDLCHFSEGKVANYKKRISQNTTSLLEVTDLYEFYADTIRPELKNKKETQSKYYQALYKRIYWKIEVTSRPNPTVKLLFLDEPSQIKEFGPDDLKDFYDCLFKFCMKQLDGIYKKKKTWIVNKIKEKKILSSFISPISRLENNLKTDWFPGNAINNLIYLLCEDREVCDELINSFFPNVQSRQKNSIVHEIPLDVTALTILCGVPIDFIPEVFKTKQTVFKNADMYLFPQEKIASDFENEIKRRLKEKITFPPDLSYLFWKKKYVLTIIDAFLLGLISAEKKESSHNRYWKLPINHSAKYFDLEVIKSPNIFEDIIRILEKIVITMPGSSQIQMNKKHPFNAQNIEQTMLNVQLLSKLELQREFPLEKEEEIINIIKDKIRYHKDSPKYYGLYQLLLLCDLNLHEKII